MDNHTQRFMDECKPGQRVYHAALTVVNYGVRTWSTLCKVRGHELKRRRVDLQRRALPHHDHRLRRGSGDHGCATVSGRYEITTAQGSVRVENHGVALTVHSALQQVGARPRLRDHGEHDPRDGVDRIEGPRVLVEVDGCQVPVEAGQ